MNYGQRDAVVHLRAELKGRSTRAQSEVMSSEISDHSYSYRTAAVSTLIVH